MSCSAQFTQHTLRVNGISFSSGGRYLVSSSEDHNIHLYDCVSGVHLAGYETTRGCEFAQFLPFCGNQIDDTTDPMVAHTSRKEGAFDLCALSLATAQYSGYYRGHQAEITSLSASPHDPRGVLASASLDGTVRLWSTSYSGPLLEIRDLEIKGGRLLCEFDPSQPRVLAVADGNRKLMLYDVRNMSAGPFAKFTLRFQNTSEKSYSSFSTSLHLHDGFSQKRSVFSRANVSSWARNTRKVGTLDVTTRPDSTPSLLPLCALCFSEDGAFIAVTSLNDEVLVLDALTGSCVGEIHTPLRGDAHPSSRGLHCAFAPTYWSNRWLGGANRIITAMSEVDGTVSLQKPVKWSENGEDRKRTNNSKESQVFPVLAKGTRQGTTHFWNVRTRTTLQILHSDRHSNSSVSPTRGHFTSVCHVKFNPRYEQMATALGNGDVLLWASG